MKNSISQNQPQVKTVTLTDGSTRPIPTGCQDARAFQRIEEAKLQARLNPKPRKATAAKVRRQPAGRSKRSAYAKMQSAIGLARITLIERVNRESIPFSGEPGEGTEGPAGRDFYGE